MEKVLAAKEKANKNIWVADHMLTQTYPIVNDPKLLFVILENVFLACTSAMAALLHYEYYHKRIPAFQDTFDAKFNMLKMQVAPRYNIKGEYITFLQEVKSLLLAHKKSPVEFVRKDVFVICSEDYALKTITVNEMKQYVAKAKVFIQEITRIIERRQAAVV